jgi:DNA repair exonuclease SbcCD ATPase subunit
MEFKSLDAEDAVNENEASKLKRMDDLRERVHALLATPLMQIVSREPVISSNITKTNVLTMNENFSNSLELYEYLLNYDKSFYKNEKIATVVPLSSNLAFPVIGFELLVSLLKNSLMDEYEASSKALEVDFKKKAIDDLSKRIEKLKDSYQNDPASYIALLEDKIKLLEGERENSIALKDSLDKIILANDGLKKENESLTKDIENLLSKLKDVEDKLKDIHLAEDLVRREYEDKLKEKNAEIVELRDSLKKKSDECVSITIEKQNALAKIDKLKEDLDSLRKNNSEQVREFELKLEEKEREIQELLEFKRLNEARFKGIQAMAGELNASMGDTSKEAFDELENEYNAFTRYYEEVWNRTKKEIIKEIKRKNG